MRLHPRLQLMLTAACICAAALPMLLVLLLTEYERRNPAPAADLIDPVGRRLWLLLAVLGLGLAFAIALGRFLAGTLQRPVRGLQAASRALAAEDYGARVPATGPLTPLELEDLGADFNRLADRLTETYTAMLDARSNLETRVAQRTQELAQRNLDLGYSRDTLYAVMESMDDGLVLITPDERIRYVNRNTRALLNWTRSFDPGRPADDLYAAVAAACQEGCAGRSELAEASALLTVPIGSRTPRYLRWQTFTIQNATGARLGRGHILTDVTQEREIDRVKTELISTVSHELRTPLTAIRASASSLLRPDIAWDDETRSDFLLTISEEAHHLQELIEALLDMSKIEAGVLRLDRFPVAIDQLVEAAVARARPAHPDWRLLVDVEPGLPVISLDRRRMEQVLLNLIDNAVKYGGQSKQVAIRSELAGDELWFSVSDQGIGIAPEHLELIFQRFHRVDSRMTRQTGGSGLGLAICRGIVEAHGGRIWVESEVGKGSTFFVALPVVLEAEPA